MAKLPTNDIPERRFSRGQKPGAPGTVLCSVCNERKPMHSDKHGDVTFRRRFGYTHRDPVCGGCS
jgi:hypothetical protein